jgi:D-alanyl-D-alanine carboxypeptidase
LASSIFKNNRRLIAVASGFQTKNDRSIESRKLHVWGLTHFDLIKIANKEAKLIINKNPTLSGDTGDNLKILLYMFDQDKAIKLINSG